MSGRNVLNPVFLIREHTGPGILQQICVKEDTATKLDEQVVVIGPSKHFADGSESSGAATCRSTDPSDSRIKATDDEIFYIAHRAVTEQDCHLQPCGIRVVRAPTEDLNVEEVFRPKVYRVGDEEDSSAPEAKNAPITSPDLPIPLASSSALSPLADLSRAMLGRSGTITRFDPQTHRATVVWDKVDGQVRLSRFCH
jgi:hypothetical protein